MHSCWLTGGERGRYASAATLALNPRSLYTQDDSRRRSTVRVVVADGIDKRRLLRRCHLPRTFQDERSQSHIAHQFWSVPWCGTHTGCRAICLTIGASVAVNGLRYREDPTIFSWELMNEPRCHGAPSCSIRWLVCAPFDCSAEPAPEASFLLATRLIRLRAQAPGLDRGDGALPRNTRPISPANGRRGGLFWCWPKAWQRQPRGMGTVDGPRFLQ